ncbi:NAD-dependent epimerase/dehydratase family protein [Ectobacillus polymachus]|uniref:NAD-dependent epimerase/dehydratase family protein n=1 Tax=Ectobacillus polymachus TaxID=1508806 RepID=UPI003A8980BB
MFTILVMGGSQFVSKALAKHFIHLGYTVDIFTRGLKQIDYEGYRKHFIGDRNNPDDLKDNLAYKEYDFIFDISAYTRDQVEKLIPFIQTEKLKRYVFFSSGAVYKPSKSVIKEDFPCGENINWGIYGLQKQEAEQFLFRMHKDNGLPITIFRPSYIYGEGNNLNREAYFFNRIEQELPIPYPSGNSHVQFIHIRDAVRVLESVMSNKESNGQAYNLSYPDPITWETLISTAERVVKKRAYTSKIDESLISDMNLVTRNYFPFRNITYLLDCQKLQKDGLYTPTIDLFSGLCFAYQYYIDFRPVLEDRAMKHIDDVVRAYV